jgi:PhnB protein
LVNKRIGYSKETISMVMPYLNFSGDCEEAFRLYQRAFGGKEPVFARYGDAPDSFYPDMDNEQKNKIMHGHVMLTETGGVSGADAIWPVEGGSAVNLHVYCPTLEKAKAAFAVLAEEGQIVGEIQKNPPPHDSGVSGMVKDKFGFVWVLSWN